MSSAVSRTSSPRRQRTATELCPYTTPVVLSTSYPNMCNVSMGVIRVSDSVALH
jgi:hypothetical protein